MGANIWQKLALATVGTVFSFAALEAKPSQAAKFTFSFIGSDVYGFEKSFGSGVLLFNDATSGLTGVGQEEASLSQLNGGFLFEYVNSYGLSLPGLDDWGRWGSSNLLSSPVFTFESGSLIAMNLNLAPKSGTWRNPGQGGGLWVQEETFSVTGANFKQKASQVIKGAYNPFCNPYSLIPDPPYYIYDPEKCRSRDYPGPTYEKTGQINFTTVVPFQRPKSVPEPGSVIGFSVLGLSLLLKKKVASSQRT